MRRALAIFAPMFLSSCLTVLSDVDLAEIPGGVIEFPFDYVPIERGGTMISPCVADRRLYRCMLDTGFDLSLQAYATVHVPDVRNTGRNTFKMTEGWSTYDIPTDRIYFDEFTLGRLHARSVLLQRVNIERDHDITVGNDLVDGRRLEIASRRRTYRITPSDPKPLRFRLTDIGVYLLETGDGTRLAFDTGAFMTIVTPRFYQRYAAHFRPVPGKRLKIGGIVGRIGEGDVFRIDGLELGPLSLDGHEVVVVSRDAKIYDVILGANSIIRQDWILDLGTHTWDLSSPH